MFARYQKIVQGIVSSNVLRMIHRKEINRRFRTSSGLPSIHESFNEWNAEKQLNQNLITERRNVDPKPGNSTRLEIESFRTRADEIPPT